MNWLLFIIVFLLIFFLYIHISYHYKIVNRLDIYDMNYVDKKSLEEVCVLRQPVTFILDESMFEKYFNLQQLTQGFTNMSLQIQDSSCENSKLVSVSISKAGELLKSSKEYLSYNNLLFVDDTLTKNKLSYLDSYLSPPMTIQSIYDVWLGTENSKMSIKSSNYYREYLYVTCGSIECILITPNKLRQQLILLNKKDVLYIPPYWNYEIIFKKDAFVCVFRYDSILSYLSKLPIKLKTYLQQQPDKVGVEPDKVGAEPDKVGAEPDKVGVEPDKVGVEPDKVGVESDKVGVTEVKLKTKSEENINKADVSNPVSKKPRDKLSKNKDRKPKSKHRK